MSLLLAAVSCLKEERSPDEILIPSLAQVKCEESSFEMTSTVPKGTEDIVYSCGFYVGKDNSLSGATKVTATMQANTFSAPLPSRDYGTDYYICSFVTNGHELEFKSDVTTFSLKSIEEYVGFGDVTILNYDKDSRVVEISVAADIWSGVQISEIGVCYGKDQTSLTLDGTHTAGKWSAATTRNSEQGLVTITLTGFDDATEYYLRPYIKDGDYLSFGDIVPFYIPTTPIVLTSEPAGVTATSAEFIGEVVSDGGSTVSERGFVWLEGDSVPTTASNKRVIDGTTGPMSCVAGLSPNKEFSYCAYAVNQFGTAYGAPVRFTTPVDLPEVSPAVVSSVTANTAVFSGVVSYHGGETVSEVGFYYSTEQDVDTETSLKVNQAYAGDDFSLEAKELLPNTDYYVKSYAVNSAGVAYGEVKTFKTSSSSPTVVTVGVTDITSTSALLAGSVVSDNGAEITEKGFVWIQGDGTPTMESHKLKAEGSADEFSARLDNLEQNKRYSFRAYAVNSKGTSLGEIVMFSTSAGLPVLSSIDVSDITSTSANFSSTVIGHGGSTVTEVGFYYSTSPEVDPELSDKVSQQYAKDAFTLSVSELQIYQKYYVKAYAVNPAGVAFSSVVEFVTLSSTPVVNTISASDITPSTATLNGEVVTDNGASITERGFMWVEGKGIPTMSSDVIKVGGTTGHFSSILSELKPNQVYSYRAYAKNANGTSYGETIEVATVPDQMALTTGQADDVTPLSASISGTITYYGGNEIVECGVCWSTTQDPTVADSHVAATETASDFTVTLTGLNENTTYYARAYATAKSGVSYYGNHILFTTPYIVVLPASSKVVVTDITVSGATVSSRVTSDGHGTVTDAGFVYSTSSSPTIDDSKISCGVQAGDYTSQLTGLADGTTYYVRSYVSNEIGTAYGEEVAFTTVAIKLPDLTSVTVANVTYNSASFSAQVASLNNGILSDAGFVYSTSPGPDVNSNKLSCGKTTALEAPSVPLRASTTYYVRAYAVNEKGTAYGEEISFTTEESPGQSDVDADDFTPEVDWD